MGKGSNVQKAQAARERNQKNMGKTPEERAAAAAKAKKDSTAFMCAICRQTFMVNAKKSVLYLHVTAKHTPEQKLECFPVELKDYDPEDPDGTKKAAADDAAKKASAAKRAAKKGTAGLDDLLNAGLKKK